MSEFKKIEYIDRKTGETLTEKVLGENFMKFLYYNPLGKLTLDAIVKRKFLTTFYGRKMDDPRSKERIAPFVNNNDIDMSESQKNIEDFNSFNDFFIRKLKKDARKIDLSDNVIISPADGKVLVFENITNNFDFFIKGNKFNLNEFFMDEKLSKKYEGGTFLIVRLAPADYHRFHFPLDGEISDSKLINGHYYSVSTHAIRNNFKIFYENKREYSILKTEKFGDVAMFEIGATMVGGIKQTYKPNSFVKKGDEKGYFYFGGSTCILLFEKDKVQIDADLIENTKKGIETKIYMGEKIGNEKKG